MSNSEYDPIEITKLALSILESVKASKGDEYVKAAALRSAAAIMEETAKAKMILTATATAFNNMNTPKR